MLQLHCLRCNPSAATITRVFRFVLALLLVGYPQCISALSESVVAPNVVDLKNVSINFRDGKSKVILFLSAKCPCSASHENLIKELSKEFPGISFYGISSNSNEKLVDVSQHFKEVNFTFPLLHDKDAKIADEFGALKTPHAFIVNGNGDILYSGGVTNSAHAPGATKQYLKEALINVVAGKNPEPREVRTLGCVILRP